MKQLLPYIVILILGFALARQCDRPEPEPVIRTIEVEVPVVEHQFDTVFLPVASFIHKTDTIVLQEFLSASDSLKIAMYVNATLEREYSQNFTDSIQSIDVWSKTRGELLEQNVSYKTFPRTITHIDTLPPAKRHRSLYILPEVGASANFDKVKFRASLLYQDRKERIYTFGVDSDAVFSVGAGWKLF